MTDGGRAGALAALRALVAADLERRGHTRAGLATAVLVARGRLGLDPEGFGRLLRVPGWVVVLLERGHTAPERAPAALAATAPDIDWAELGVGIGAGRARPSSRHPAAHQVGRGRR